MRKLMHHYQKNLASVGDTDRIEWDLYRLTLDGAESYELKGTVTHHTSSPYSSPKSYSHLMQTPLPNVDECEMYVESHDMATGIIVVVTTIPCATLEAANLGFSEIINRLVSQ